jgi:solute:Na+ symporter, SSS family
MAPLDYAIVLAYIAGMLLVGAALARRIGGFRDYFVAGHSLTTPLLVCSLVSTYYGLDVLFGASEVAYQEGLVAWFAYTRPYYFAILLAALFVARRLRRHDFLSLPEVAGHYYGSGTRAVIAVANALYALPLMSIMGIGVLLDVVAGVPFVWGVLAGAAVALAYTLLGGLLADAFTDTIQFVLMCVTLGLATVLALRGVGGFEGLERVLPASYLEPWGTYPTWLLIVFAGSALSALVEPAFYQRIFAAVSYRSVLIALLIGIALWAAFDWVVTVLGIAALAGGLETDPRYALITLVMEVLPAGARGLFVAGVLATAMSTIDSYLLIAGGSVAYDIYRPLVRPGLPDARLLRLTRWMVLVAALASVVLALFFRSMVTAWIFMSTLLVATALVPILAGLYAPRRPKVAAGLAASVAGLATAIAFFATVALLGTHDPELGARVWTVTLYGREVGLWQEYALLPALPASVAGFVAGQLLGRREAPPPAPGRVT